MSVINNRSFCPILVRFVHYYSSFWGPRAISTIDKPQCVCTCRSSTFANLVDSDPFHGLLLTVLGSKVISIVLRVGHQHSRILSILTHFVDYYSPFWGPEAIPWLLNPKVCLRVGHQHSQFWPILAGFVQFDSSFCGPRAISMIYEPRSAFTCRSSTLTVFVDSGPFRGLLLTVLGYKRDFHD